MHRKNLKTKNWMNYSMKTDLRPQLNLKKYYKVNESTVSKRLKVLGTIQKQGHWVPYELKLLLCIRWDQQGIIYYELLKPNQTITGDRY